MRPASPPCCQDRRHVWLDSGTTATEVARQLRQRDMTLMPMSLRAVNALTDGGPAAGRHPELLLPGGSLIRRGTVLPRAHDGIQHPFAAV